MVYVYAQLEVCVTILSNGSTELHALTLAACSFALLQNIIEDME